MEKERKRENDEDKKKIKKKITFSLPWHPNLHNVANMQKIQNQNLAHLVEHVFQGLSVK